MIYTTLNRIREHGPRAGGWKKLLAHLGKSAADGELLAYSEILKSNGLGDALLCLRAEPQHSKLWRLYAVRCARRVQHLMGDPRSIAALDVAERHANGSATDAELAAARAAAWAVAWNAAEGVVGTAARTAAWTVAEDAAEAAALAAALAAAMAAARAEMSADFLAMVSAGESE